jgi:hypothetical protein
MITLLERGPRKRGKKLYRISPPTPFWLIPPLYIWRRTGIDVETKKRLSLCGLSEVKYINIEE